jgi:hypothetical protein
MIRPAVLCFPPDEVHVETRHAHIFATSRCKRSRKKKETQQMVSGRDHNPGPRTYFHSTYNALLVTLVLPSRAQTWRHVELLRWENTDVKSLRSLEVL